MQYRVLGNTGIEVSAVCLGTATFGIAPLEEDAGRLVGRALQLGINFFNTATHYGNRRTWDRPGVPTWDQRLSAEESLGNALRGHRHEVFITTKVGMDVRDAGPNGGGRHGGGLTRRMIRDRVEMSLRRLGTDYVDFLYGQSVDRNTPLEVTLRAFDDLVREGKVLYFGLSNFPAWQTVDAVRITEREHLHPILGQEIAYNLVQRDVERELIPACQRLGLGLTTYAPLAGGLLAGARAISERPVSQLGFQRWRLGQGPGFSEREIRAAEELDRLSDEWAVPAPQLALAWLLTRPTVASVIIGPESIGELEQNAPAGDLELDEAQVAELDAIGASP
jgi:aryl-alcohol dehydrogenase-like predicted oxidoreductase